MFTLADWLGGDKICDFCSKFTEKQTLEYATGVPNILHLRTLKKLVPAWLAATKQFNGVKNDWQDEQVGTD